MCIQERFNSLNLQTVLPQNLRFLWTSWTALDLSDANKNTNHPISSAGNSQLSLTYCSAALQKWSLSFKNKSNNNF